MNTFRKHGPVIAALVVVAGGLGVGSLASAGPTGAALARATLVDSAGNVVGTARLVEDATGEVHLNVKVAGLSEGLHGIHIHAVGSCVGPGFTSAGGHFNPTGALHGGHAGDLPNLRVNVAGQGSLNAAVDTVALTSGSAAASVFDADGSAIVIHADQDDYATDPSGKSGPRIACGVITSN